MSTESLGEAYRDRNLLALAFAHLVDAHHDRLIHSEHLARYADDFRAGWHPPTDEDDADAAEWAVVWCRLPTGQVSWHVPRHQALASSIPQVRLPWDGHDRAEKNRRLQAFALGHVD